MVDSVESKIAVQSDWRGKTDILQPNSLCNCAVRFQDSVILPTHMCTCDILNLLSCDVRETV